MVVVGLRKVFGRNTGAEGEDDFSQNSQGTGPVPCAGYEDHGLPLPAAVGIP
jgi:hypothetical protein